MKTMISAKTLAITSGLTILTFGSGFGQASERNQAYIEACRGEIQQYYGEDKLLSVVNTRRGAEGIRVTLAARADENNAEFINCWIPNNAETAPLDLGSDKLAAIISPVPVIR